MPLDGERLIAEAGEILGLPLNFDVESRRAVIVDKATGHECLIELPQKGAMIYLYTVIKKLCSEIDNGPFLLSLLEMNLFGLQTNAATISVDGSASTVVLHIAFPIEFLTPQLLVNLLGNFMEASKKLREKVKNLLHRTTAEARRRRTHFSVSEVMDNERPKSSVRVMRI